MRWDYLKPSQKSFMINGKSLWLYQKKDKVAQIDRCFKQDALTSSISFLWGSKQILQEFSLDFFKGQFGKKSDYHLTLTPKKKSGIFKRIILVIDPENFRVKQSIIVDLQGNVNQFIYNKMVFNKKLSQKQPLRPPQQCR